MSGIHLVARAGRYTILSAVDIAWLQEHVDHDVVQVGVGAADPLGNDQDAQVAEQGIQEDHLRHKFTDDGELVPEVALVEQGQNDSDIHLGNACANSTTLLLNHRSRNAQNRPCIART